MNSTQRQQYKTLFLGAMYQCAHMVHKIATQGVARFKDYEAVCRILFARDDEELKQAVENPIAFTTGLTQLSKQLASGDGSGTENLETLRYIINLVSLERTLASNTSLLSTVSQKVQDCQDQYGDDVSMLNERIETLAEIYTDNISLLEPRIRVKGNREHINHANNAARIRSILLAGLRSAIAWRQLGGRRWHLFAFRRSYVDTANRILQHTGA